MSACLIAGDSIAVGLGAAMHHACSVDAKIGIGSAAIIGRVRDADMVVISAGSNDPHNPRLLANLKVMRAKVAGRVLWIAPIDRVAAEAVRQAASIHGDLVVTFAPAGDRVHPRSYGPLAAAVRGALAGN